MNYGEVWLLTNLFMWLSIIGIGTQILLWITQFFYNRGFFDKSLSVGEELDYIYSELLAGKILDPKQYWKEGDNESIITRPTIL